MAQVDPGRSPALLQPLKQGYHLREARYLEEFSSGPVLVPYKVNTLNPAPQARRRGSAAPNLSPDQKTEKRDRRRRACRGFQLGASRGFQGFQNFWAFQGSSKGAFECPGASRRLPQSRGLQGVPGTSRGPPGASTCSKLSEIACRNLQASRSLLQGPRGPAGASHLFQALRTFNVRK